jgi:hypothetical protein
MPAGVDDTLRRLALNDGQSICSVLDPSPLRFATSRLDVALAPAIGHDVEAAFEESDG